MSIQTAQYETDLIATTIMAKDQIRSSAIIDKISVSMITQAQAKNAWTAIKSLNSENELIDHIAVAGRMEQTGYDNFMFLADMIGESQCLEANLTRYAKRVRQSSYVHDTRSRLIKALSVVDGLNDITQVESIAASIDSIMDGLLIETNDNLPVSFKSVAKNFVDRLHDKLNGKEDEHTVMTNISDLDAHTGGFNVTDLIVVAGLSGSGKTEFTIKITNGIVKSGGGALAFSMEMSNHQIVERAISGESQLPVSQLRNPALLGDIGFARMEEGLRGLVNTNFYMTDQSGLSVDQIIATAKRHKMNHPDLKVIFVDHIGLMNLSNSDAFRHDLMVGEISKRLKALAKDIEVPVILLSQLTGKQIMARPVMEREPRAQDIKDSSRIEEDADLILLTHRQWTHDETAPNIAEIILAKARHAIKGTKVYFRFIDGHFNATAQDMAENEMQAYRERNKPQIKQKKNF